MASAFKRLLPTFNRILVKKFEKEAKTASGILLQSAPEKESYGEVVEIGPGNLNNEGKLIKLAIEKGDHVLLPEYGGSKVKLQDGEYFIYRDTDILAILKK